MTVILKYILGFCLLLSITANSQTTEEIMKKVVSQYIDAKPIKFSLRYDLYKNYSTNTIHETRLGSFIKNNKNEVLMKIGNVDLLNTKEYTLKIDHQNKAILVNTPLKTSNNLMKELTSLIKLCTEKSFKDLKTHWIIEFVPKQFSGLLYNKIVLSIGKNFTIQKQVFYYNTLHNFSKDYKNTKGEFPRLEMTYFDYSNEVNTGLINPNLYITNTNEVIIAHPKYKGYRLIDSRKKAKNKK